MSEHGQAAILQQLPLLPRDESGPVFAEPWQAQVFGVVVELIENGTITQAEWAEHLGAQFHAAEQRGEYDTGLSYYDHWLAALEQLLVDKNLAAVEDLSAEKEVIRESDHHHREHQRGGGH
jgi:nitrile hydratase accessory protein